MIGRIRLAATTVALWLLLVRGGLAHDARPGYLELRETSPGRYAILWKQPVRGEYRLPIDPVYPAECAVRGAGDLVVTTGALVSRGFLDCPGGLAGRTLAVAGLEATVTDVLVRVHHADGRSETSVLRPAAPSVTLGRPSSGAARVLAYLRIGIEHILAGWDHLLFILGLVLIVGDRWMLVKTITSFTLAHSITLAAAALGYARVPLPPVDAAIALSILFLGPEIVRVWRGQSSFTIRHPWVVAFAFGLLHGFGFASGLTAMGLPTAEIPLALLLFNLGVEAGQLAFVVLILGLERLSRLLEIRWPLFARALPGYAVGSLGAYWAIERTITLIAPPR